MSYVEHKDHEDIGHSPERADATHAYKTPAHRVKAPLSSVNKSETETRAFVKTLARTALDLGLHEYPPTAARERVPDRAGEGDGTQTNGDAEAKCITPQPQWWKLTLHTHSGDNVTRCITGARPIMDEIVRHGYHELRDNGDEFFVHAEAIGTIEISAGFATPPLQCITRIGKKWRMPK
jgi:hypothetical protein